MLLWRSSRLERSSILAAEISKRAPYHTSRAGIQRPLIAFRDMPAIFFHVKRGRMAVVDKVGLELADLDEALVGD